VSSEPTGVECLTREPETREDLRDELSLGYTDMEAEVQGWSNDVFMEGTVDEEGGACGVDNTMFIQDDEGATAGELDNVGVEERDGMACARPVDRDFGGSLSPNRL